MQSPNQLEAAPNDSYWTAIRISQARSPYYPLDELGPLCPLLDDEELLFAFYKTGSMRQKIKRFCKIKRWAGQPSIPRVMTDAALKNLLRSMCNSSDARRMLKASRENIELHDAIWAFMTNANKPIYDAAKSLCHLDRSGKKCFIKPTQLSRLFETFSHDDSPETRRSLIHIALAFAMLKEAYCAELIAEVVARYPETIPALGLSRESIAQPDGFVGPDSEPEPRPRLGQAPPSPITVASGEITESTSALSFACWVPHVDDLVCKAGALQRSLEGFFKNTEQLAMPQVLAAFVDSGHVASLLSFLESDRQLIRHQCREIQLVLSSHCSNSNEHGCELREFLRQIQGRPVVTANGLRESLRDVQQKADVLNRRTKAAWVQLRELKDEETELKALVGSVDHEFNLPEQDALPCRVLDAIGEQQSAVGNLKLKLSVEVRNRKEALTTECDRLRVKYNLNADSNLRDCLTTYEDLRRSIASAEDFEQVAACRKTLEKIDAECSRRRHQNPRALASRLREETDAFPVFLDLCRTLIDQSVPEVAFLLLYLRQQLHPFEEESVLKDRALSILLETACEASSMDLSWSNVWHALCGEPWLLRIRRDEINSTDLHERLIISLLGTALLGDIERAANILVSVGVGELGRQAFPRVLNEVLQAVVTRRPLRFATRAELATRHNQESKITESIAFEGNKYRHVQCGNATHFARFEAIQVFPALAELWSKISGDVKTGDYGTAHSRVDMISVKGWYEELVGKHDKPVVEHPHFSEKIRSFMGEFLTNIHEHLAYCATIWQSGQLVLAQEEVSEALKQWGRAQTGRRGLSRLVVDNLMQPMSDSSRPKALWSEVALCKNIIVRCPSVIIWLRSQLSPEPDLKLEQLILEDLACDRQPADAASILQGDAAWEQIGVLQRSTGVVFEKNWFAKHGEVMAELANRRGEVLATNSARQIEAFDACVHGSRSPAARQLLEQCGRERATVRAHARETVCSVVADLIGQIGEIKDVAAEANMPEEWQENVCRLAGNIERQLRNLRRSEEPRDVIGDTQGRLRGAVAALNFVVQQNTQVFDEVEHHLDRGREEGTPRTIATNDRQRALENCPDLHKFWAILASSAVSDEAEAKRAWTQFVREFAKICNLYHDEHDQKKRFVTVPSIKYPFVVHQTAFYKPQSAFLKRPLRLYLFRQNDVDLPALQRLEGELFGDDSAAWLHVVFAPNGLERIRGFFKYDKGFKNFLLVDESFLLRISSVDKPDVPVRQALHASVTDLANSSPFVAQGYCHQTNNIYVGRKDILKKLLNTPQAMIWGGRRIGKTSVLHTLENALGNRNYSVAYVYVDLQDKGDPDLSIAQKISTTLGLENVHSIADFERQVTALRNNGSRVAFLIDEVDEYIKKSRLVHGDAFPLATALRQLVMDDSAKETILVYSGYHQLYYEAKLNKGKRRVGHPFINIAQDIPIRDLSYDDVHELVMTGFQEMLGVSVSPEVPPLISKRASRHPAFVQQFCRCLLELVSRRRSPGKSVTITPDDVEAVSSADGTGDGGEEPFIFYVNDTLSLNLSYLGRAIMLAIAEIPSTSNGEREAFLSIREISDELNTWCGIVGIANPEPEHFHQTIELLVMTNMLTQNPLQHDNYRVTYPTYIDILRRLDKLGRTVIQDSLSKYDREERDSGVLL